MENNLLNDLIPRLCFGKNEYEPDPLQAFHRLKQQLYHSLTVNEIYFKLIVFKHYFIFWPALCQSAILPVLVICMLLAQLFSCPWVDNWKSTKGAGFVMNWKDQYSPTCSLLGMDIHIKVVFPEPWNGELVIDEHIQIRSNPKEGGWECWNRRHSAY